MSRKSLAGLFALIVALSAPVVAYGEPYKHKPNATAVGSGGAAATVDSVATNAAVKVLKQGGNAVDAAVAAAAVLGVTEPYSSGIGGGGYFVIRRPNGKVVTIDSREFAPASMKPDSFIENGKPLKFSEARYSGLSTGVPGTVAGWDSALKRYGSWRFNRVLQPAIDVARQGFVVDQTFFDQTEDNAPYFDDIPSTAKLYLAADGGPLKVGSIVRNPDLADTYTEIARKGARRGFYDGETAAAIVAAVNKPPVGPKADKTWRPGKMTMRDLSRYKAVSRKPTKISYRGYDVFGMPPSSSGGATVGEALNILEALPDYRNASETKKRHYFLEASRYSFADRNGFLGDPKFLDIPLKGLLSDKFAADRAKLIGPKAATSPVAPGNPGGKTKPTKARTSVYPGQSTTHLTVADKDGMVVAYTFTIESTGGNGIVVPRTGIMLNNELTDFNFDAPKHPNAPAGGKRPRSSMAPTYVERNGRPFLALGSPGGATIITTVLQVLTERIDFGRTLPEAIASPRASQRNLEETAVEQGFLDENGSALEALGHKFGELEEIGTVAAIEFGRRGAMTAAAEPKRRGGGSAGVVQRSADNRSGDDDANDGKGSNGSDKPKGTGKNKGNKDKSKPKSGQGEGNNTDSPR